jgi:peptide methionine sulfoxide reductase MsrB
MNKFLFFLLILCSCSTQMTFQQIQVDADKICGSPDSEFKTGHIGCHIGHIFKECSQHKEILECDRINHWNQ